MKKQSLVIVAIIIFFIGTAVFIGTMKKMKKDAGNSPELSESVKNKNVDGIIQNVSGNTVTVKVAASKAGVPDSLERVITLNTGTKIRHMVPKDSTRMQEELMVYYEKMKQKELPPHPEYTETKDVSPNTLAAGQTIVVVLAPDNNKGKTQFIASEILIMPNLEDIENLKQSVYQALIGAPALPTMR